MREKSMPRELAHAGSGEFRVEDGIRPSTEVNHHAGEGFVHRHVTMRGTGDPASVPKSLVEGFTQADEGIFGSVVFVYV